MKIAVITAATFTVPLFRVDMIDEFVSRGHDVLVLGDEPEENWSEYFDLHSVSYRSFPVSRNGIDPISDAVTLRTLARSLDSEKPSKVFTYQAKPNIYGSLAAHFAGAQVYPMMGGIGSVFMPRTVKDRFVKKILSTEYKVAFKRAEKVFFQNRDDIDLFVGSGLVNRKQVVKINGSGVNLNRFEYSDPPARPSFLYIGRLIRDKGIYEYIDAAKIVKKTVPNSEFHIVGGLDSNPSALTENELNECISGGSVIWHGFQEDVRPFLNKCSVFVLPSYREGTPKAALEAMACGRAIVTTDAPGCREVVRNGANGRLVAAGDSTSLAQALIELANDMKTVAAMGRESRRMAETYFDVKKINEVICSSMGI